MKVPQFIKNLYIRYFVPVQKGKCLFIPHDGFCMNDKASIINKNADNCLIFARYILDNGLYKDKELVIVSTTPECAQMEEEWCQKHYPEANVHIIPLNQHLIKENWLRSEYVFSSETKFPYSKYSRDQHYIVLAYYSVALKNDYFAEGGSRLPNRVKWAQATDMIVSSSLIHSQIDSSAYSLSFKKYNRIGICRSDALLKEEDMSYVKKYFKNLCGDYTFSKILLYVPTYRDYEISAEDANRFILGFEMNKNQFGQFLRDNELLVVCKLHPCQNTQAIKKELPEGIVLFQGSEDFGLTELMKVSDMLITDYTSAYVDYLLLDKPVLFNFYDLEQYEKTRGLSFHPIERICAGDIFRDEKSFYNAVSETLSDPGKYSDKRKEMVEYLNTYHTDVCAKTYQTVFSNNQG